MDLGNIMGVGDEEGWATIGGEESNEDGIGEFGGSLKKGNERKEER